MNEKLKQAFEALDLAKYRSPAGRMKKDTPPEIKTLIKVDMKKGFIGSPL